MSDLAKGIIAHYERHAAAWDRDRQGAHWNDKVWHDRFIDRLASDRLGKSARVLDLGTRGE
jgi:hypothetical protein